MRFLKNSSFNVKFSFVLNLIKLLWQILIEKQDFGEYGRVWERECTNRKTAAGQLWFPQTAIRRK